MTATGDRDCPKTRCQTRLCLHDSTGVEEITDNLARAFDRIDDFAAVQSGRAGEELVEAVTRLQESIGIFDGPRALIAERLEGIRGHERTRVLLGLIVDLMAAELDAETH